MSCSTCTPIKTVTICTNNLVIGQITDKNTAVYIFFLNTRTGYKFRATATSDTTTGLITVDISAIGNNFTRGDSYEVWITLADQQPEQRENVYIAGLESTCFEVCFDFIYDESGVTADYTTETFTLSESFTEVVPEIHVDNDVPPVFVTPGNIINYWENQGSSLIDFDIGTSAPLWDSGDEAFNSGNGWLETDDLVLSDYHHIIMLIKKVSGDGVIFSQWDTGDISNSRFNLYVDSSGYFGAKVADGSTEYELDIHTDLSTNWAVVESIWDGTDHNIYIDGLKYQMQSSDTNGRPSSLNDSTLDIMIGGEYIAATKTTTGYFGRIKALKFYDVAITPQQRQRDILEMLKRV